MKNFQAGGSHKILLSGTSLQTVSFMDPNSGYSHFNILETTNSSAEGISFLSKVGWTNIVTNGNKINNLNLHTMAWTLSSDETFACDFELSVNSTIDLNGHTLTVEGDFLHSSGILKVNGGKLVVNGDYRIQSVSGDGYSFSNGRLDMTNAIDHVLVYGDFIMDSRINHTAYLTSGLLELKGNFIQQSLNSSTDAMKNVQAGGSHKVLLSGTSLQTVYFMDSNSGYSHFNILGITNNSNHGVELHSNIVAIGNVNLYCCYLNINGRTATISSNLNQHGGNIDLNGGSLNISGNHTFYNDDMDCDGIDDDWEIDIFGDITTADESTDYDEDGLMDWYEINIHHTDPNNPDSDGDGLLDGEEVNTHFTDPNLEDTDSDGYSDFVEILAGSDPLDHDSIPPLPEDRPLGDLSEISGFPIGFLSCAFFCSISFLLINRKKKKAKPPQKI